MSALNRTVLQLFSVALTLRDKDPDDRDVDTEEQAEAQLAAEAPRRGAAGGVAAPKVEVKIEWDGLDRRIRQLTHLSESVMSVVPSPESRTYAFLAAGGGVGAGQASGPAVYVIADDLL